MAPLTRTVSQIRNFPRANLHGITRKVLIRFNKPRLFVAKLDFRSKELKEEGRGCCSPSIRVHVRRK